MKRLIILSLAVTLGSGCVTHKYCVVTTRPDSTVVELHKERHGLIFGVGGLTTQAYDNCIFWLPGQKVEYAGSEVQEISDEPNTNDYSGTICIDRDQKHVVVKLSQFGHPIQENGTYRHPRFITVMPGRIQY